MARTSNDVTQCRQPEPGPACCLDCGALECLCRPRFFAGQLLSEQDLNRLDQYIRNKHRLQTRHLHGWGVVNGLKVVCDPCDQILVTQGYAVDPCGVDIVVCEDAKVDICELIRCCKQRSQPECAPFRTPPNSNCDEAEEEWVLTLRYEEWASRGVTALRGTFCGPVSAPTAVSPTTDCGCGGTSKTAARVQPAVRGAPQQCEPTVTCEGYRFGVYRKPADDDGDDDDDRLFDLQGSFWDQFNCCAEPLVNKVPPMPDLSNDDDLLQVAIAISQWCCQFRDNLLNYFLTHRSTSCEIIDFLRAINCPNINAPNTFVIDFVRSFLQLIAAWGEGLKNCFCLSLLPPVPQATADTRVPLATVRIRARDCKVLGICNWTRERKMMVTWPAAMHWISIVPIADFIRDLMDRICCGSLLGIFDDVIRQFPQRDAQFPTTGSAPSNHSSSDVGKVKAVDDNSFSFAQGLHLASGAMASGFNLNLGDKVNRFVRLGDSLLSRGFEPIELGALLNAVSPRFKLPDNDRKLSDIEARNLPSLVLSEVMIKPVLSSFIGNKLAAGRVAEFQQGLFRSTETATAAEKPADMKKQVETLRAQLRQQESLLNELQKKIDG